MRKKNYKNSKKLLFGYVLEKLQSKFIYLSKEKDIIKV